MSKGSTQRPIEDKKAFDNNWEAIFGKKSKEDSKEKEPENVEQQPA
jgi:hypothetical protein